MGGPSEMSTHCGHRPTSPCRGRRRSSRPTGPTPVELEDSLTAPVSPNSRSGPHSQAGGPLPWTGKQRLVLSRNRGLGSPLVARVV